MKRKNKIKKNSPRVARKRNKNKWPVALAKTKSVKSSPVQTLKTIPGSVKSSLVQTRKTIADKFRRLYKERADGEKKIQKKYGHIADSLKKVIGEREEIERNNCDPEIDNERLVEIEPMEIDLIDFQAPTRIVHNALQPNTERPFHRNAPTPSRNGKATKRKVEKNLAANSDSDILDSNKRYLKTKKQNTDEEERREVKRETAKVIPKSIKRKVERISSENSDSDIYQARPSSQSRNRVKLKKTENNNLITDDDDDDDNNRPILPFPSNPERARQYNEQLRSFFDNIIDEGSKKQEQPHRKRVNNRDPTGENDDDIISPEDFNELGKFKGPGLKRRKITLKRVEKSELSKIIKKIKNKQKRMKMRQEEMNKKYEKILNGEEQKQGSERKMKRNSGYDNFRKINSSESPTEDLTIVSPEDFDDDCKYKGPGVKRSKIAIPVARLQKSIKKIKTRKYKHGGHLERKFIPYTENIVYEYYDDPNELCDRLKLLLSSKGAGNTNHDQEINSIIEELRERNVIA